MDKCSHGIPDLIVNLCPLGCNGTCVRIWMNEKIGHSIICNCTCHNKKLVTLGEVEGPGPNDIHLFESLKEASKERDD